MQHLALWIGVAGFGGHVGMVFWILSGYPPNHPELAIAGSIASSALLMAGLLWRYRVVQRRKIVLAPDRWPCQDFSVCTEEERRADLLAMAEGRITLEEWQERRRARPSPPRVKSDANFKEDLRIRIIEEIRKRRSVCLKCLGIHEPGDSLRCYPENYVTSQGYEDPLKTMSEIIRGDRLDTSIPSAFKPGDRVRVTCPISSLHQRIGQLVEQLFDDKWGGTRAWQIFWGGSIYNYYETEFIRAVPRKGEVWRYMPSCDKCEISDTPRDIFLTIERDWQIVSSEIAQRINCGCFYLMGMDDKK
jgi:hypothetical protein